MTDDDTDRHRKLIEDQLKSDGFSADSWRESEDGLEAILKGEWQVIEDDDEAGLFAGDAGTLSASVLGAPQYGNEHVSYAIALEDQEIPLTCKPYENVEPI